MCKIIPRINCCRMIPSKEFFLDVKRQRDEIQICYRSTVLFWFVCFTQLKRTKKDSVSGMDLARTTKTAENRDGGRDSYEVIYGALNDFIRLSNRTD